MYQTICSVYFQYWFDRQNIDLSKYQNINDIENFPIEYPCKLVPPSLFLLICLNFSWTRDFAIFTFHQWKFPYFKISQFLWRETKDRAKVWLWSARDGNVGGHVDTYVGGTDILIVTHARDVMLCLSDTRLETGSDANCATKMEVSGRGWRNLIHSSF